MERTQRKQMTAGGSIVTTYDAQTITTTGSPPLAARHKDEVVARFNSVPPDLTQGPQNPIMTQWYAKPNGAQLIEVNHSPANQTSAEWRRKWIELFESQTTSNVPV